MTGYDEPGRSTRFGAATPGARPSAPSLEALLAPPGAPPGRRWWTLRWVRVVAGALVLAGGGFAAGHFTAGSAPARPTELMVTDTALPAGARLTGADLRAVPVQAGARTPAGAMAPAAAASMIGLVVAQGVPAGTFLERSLLTSRGALPDPAQALVGLALKPGQLPAGGLSVGQQVLVVMLRASSSGVVQRPVPLAVTSVWYLQGGGSSGTTQASVIVPAHEAALLSSYAAQQDVALVATDVPKGGAGEVIPSPAPTPTPVEAPPSANPAPSPSADPPAHPSAQPTRTATKPPKDGK